MWGAVPSLFFRACAPSPPFPHVFSGTKHSSWRSEVLVETDTSLVTPLQYKTVCPSPFLVFFPTVAKSASVRDYSPSVSLVSLQKRLLLIFQLLFLVTLHYHRCCSPPPIFLPCLSVLVRGMLNRPGCPVTYPTEKRTQRCRNIFSPVLRIFFPPSRLFCWSTTARAVWLPRMTFVLWICHPCILLFFKAPIHRLTKFSSPLHPSF